MEDGSMEFSVMVDRSVGGSSLADGEIELMLHRFLHLFSFYSLCHPHILHEQAYNLAFLGLVNILWYSTNDSCCRRLIHDDGRGVGEVLNETVCVLDKCEGLTVSISLNFIFTSILLYSHLIHVIDGLCLVMMSTCMSMHILLLEDGLLENLYL